MYMWYKYNNYYVGLGWLVLPLLVLSLLRLRLARFSVSAAVGLTHE